MILLFRADLLKLRKHLMGWSMLVISVALVTLLMVVLSSLDVSPNPLAPLFNTPGGLIIGPQLLGELGSLMVTVLGAMLVGSEYRYDTWKNVLTRRAGRVPFMLSKWLTLLLSVAIGVTVVALCSQIMVLILGPMTGTTPPTLSRIMLGLGLQVMVWLTAGTIAIFGAVISRSTVGGIIVGIVWTLADSVLSQVLPEAARAPTPLALPRTTSLQRLWVSLGQPAWSNRLWCSLPISLYR